MPLQPLSQAIDSNSLRNVRFIATDMDGTLTNQGKFTSSLIQTLEQLADAGIQVLIVTGRSAGWVNGLAAYLPIVGAIAENGGLFYQGNCETPELLTPIADLGQHRQKLAQTFQDLKIQFPNLQETGDNRFRLTDWTFDVRGLNQADLQTLAAQCEHQGWSFTYSNVQCHIKPFQQDKAIALTQVLSRYFPHYSLEQVLTVGDSPNDASLFDSRQFPLSVGVANVLHYADQLPYSPTYVTTAAEGTGFCELARSLLATL